MIRLDTEKEEKMITIDGSLGEGGGQILRTSLALSLTTQKAFRIKNIRAKRRKPGLLPQHLTALRAASEIGKAHLTGDQIGSLQVTFEPGNVVPGDYHFTIGTAGSGTLVLQTVLPALMTVSRQTRLVIEGGTHNLLAPSFDFIQKSFLPCIEKMGPKITAILDRYGFYPAGGGIMSFVINPDTCLKGLHILERGELKSRQCIAMVSKLDPNIGRREIKVVQKKMNFPEGDCNVMEIKDSPGPGNSLIIKLCFENICEVFTGFGERGKPAERVAEEVVNEAQFYLSSGAAIGKYLADQLLLPLALAGEGTLRTLPPSQHTLTNIEVIKKFLDLDIVCQHIQGDIWEIAVRQ
jgi:RNA 3'-terminal phosphate cyclase (ATP)